MRPTIICDFLASSDRAGRSHQDRRQASSARRYRGEPPNRPIYIACDEWNVWYRARGNTQRGRRILEEHYNLEDALVVATFLNYVREPRAHREDRQHGADRERDRADIHQRKRHVPADHLLSAAAVRGEHARRGAGDVLVESPSYESKTYGKTPYLDVSSSLKRPLVTMNVVNRHLDQEVEAEIEIQDGAFRADSKCR